MRNFPETEFFEFLNFSEFSKTMSLFCVHTLSLDVFGLFPHFGHFCGSVQLVIVLDNQFWFLKKPQIWNVTKSHCLSLFLVLPSFFFTPEKIGLSFTFFQISNFNFTLFTFFDLIFFQKEISKIRSKIRKCYRNIGKVTKKEIA